MCNMFVSHSSSITGYLTIYSFYTGLLHNVCERLQVPGTSHCLIVLKHIVLRPPLSLLSLRAIGWCWAED